MPHTRRHRAASVALAAIALLVALAVPTGTTATAGENDAPAASAEPSAIIKTREVVSTSVNGRPIVLIHRARPEATRRLLVIGSMHGDERAGTRVVRRLLTRAKLPRDLDLWLIPTMNPDGAAADRRTNANGVDLNRNFPYRWHRSARTATWSGTRPLSEPESETVRSVVRRVDPQLTVIFHQPLFGVGKVDGGMRTVRALAAGMRLPVREYSCGSVCYGTFSGWVNHRTDGLAVTVEFGRSASAWRIGRAATTLVQVGTGH